MNGKIHVGYRQTVEAELEVREDTYAVRIGKLALTWSMAVERLQAANPAQIILTRQRLNKTNQ
jgi:hypothetical protein